MCRTSLAVTSTRMKAFRLPPSEAAPIGPFVKVAAAAVYGRTHDACHGGHKPEFTNSSHPSVKSRGTNARGLRLASQKNSQPLRGAAHELVCAGGFVAEEHGDAHSFYDLGVPYFKQARYEDARRAYERALQPDPDAAPKLARRYSVDVHDLEGEGQSN